MQADDSLDGGSMLRLYRPQRYYRFTVFNERMERCEVEQILL